MRADRLIATLLLLQARGRVTAAALAEELEISVATARRDLEALAASGVPVYPQPGRGGGWSLVGGARTDLTGLTSAEAKALFLLAGPGAALAPPVRSALRKLVRALPGTFRAEAEAAADAVTIDAARWGDNDRDRPTFVEALQDAIISRRKITITYPNRDRDPTQRLVDPWGLAAKDGIWYLIAGTDKGQRTFRVDRIIHIDISELVSQRPADFTLSQEWEHVVDNIEQRRSPISATVLIATRRLHVLQRQFGRHCTPLDTQPDGRLRVRIAAHMPLSIAERIAGWGNDIEVLDPESVRTELARLGSELLTRYR